MPLIPTTIRGFPPGGGVPNGTAALDLSWDDIVRAAISVGRRSLEHIVQHGLFSVFEMSYRIAMIYANLMEGADGSLVRSSAYEGLDPSEKSAISYFLGLTLTKAFAEQRLQVAWLMHVDVYRQQFNLDMAREGGRPDLFGIDLQQRWIVAESKGRTNGHDERALQRAKEQAAQVANIEGEPPFLSIGLVTSFAGGRLSIVVDDPPAESGSERIYWNISKEKVRDDYYRPFRTALDQLPSRVEQVRGRMVRTVRLADTDTTVGMEADLQTVAPDRIVGAIPNDPAAEGSLGLDGVYVRLGNSWSEDRMRLQPQARAT